MEEPVYSDQYVSQSHYRGYCLSFAEPRLLARGLRRRGCARCMRRACALESHGQSVTELHLWQSYTYAAIMLTVYKLRSL